MATNLTGRPGRATMRPVGFHAAADGAAMAARPDPEQLTVCHRTTCRACAKTTWAGCGQHVEQALAGVPAEQRCSCTLEERAEAARGRSVLDRILGR